MTSQVLGPGLTMANTPRPAADGMDSEVLRQQDLKNASQQPKHLRISPPSSNRHRNLNASPSSTTFSKVSGAVYIPHEPVKGAVKATLRSYPSKMGTKTDKLNANVLSQTTNYREKNLLKIKPGLSEDRISFDNPIKPQMTVAEAVGSKPSATGVATYNIKELVKSIQVPFYNAPGHLSAKTYQTMEKYHKDQLDRETNKLLTQNIGKAIKAPNSPPKSKPAAEVSITIDTDDRRVEGQVTSPADTLKKEVENLKDQLHVQTKVNGELKKLLVASMGDDLHYRVECLVRTNAQLAADMGLYSNKISQDGENIDHLGIQADIWRSKYHASRFQVDELLALKSATSQRYEQSCTALEELLKERYQLRDSLFNTYRVLQQLCDAFEPLPPTNRPASYAPKSVTDIAVRNYKLADNMKFRLLGTIQLYPALYNTAIPNVMTPAEQMGIQILTEKPDMTENENGTAMPNLQLNSQIETKFNRHSPHPYARYDNVTFNCCRRCSGEIKIV